jgi:hypothetical protein
MPMPMSMLMPMAPMVLVQPADVVDDKQVRMRMPTMFLALILSFPDAETVEIADFQLGGFAGFEMAAETHSRCRDPGSATLCLPEPEHRTVTISNCGCVDSLRSCSTAPDAHQGNREH